MMQKKTRVLFVLVALVLGSLGVAQAADGVVNVNTASVDELMLLPRVGPTVAARIVEFREENGSFEQAEDLLLVRGIGDRTFDLIEPWIALEGETTLQEKVRASEAEGDSEEGA
jgi:competence protein ComEA